MGSGIIELAFVILLAATLGAFAYVTRQPIFLAYLGTGVVIGGLNLFHLGEREIFEIFSTLGIMFLLFLIGLEINYSSLRHVGKTSLIIGCGQILFTTFFGFMIASWGFGYQFIPALYIAVALTFSSTVIIVKLLSEKKDLNSLYGRISVGFFLVQDFVAMIILIVLAGVTGTGGSDSLLNNVVLTLVKGVGLFAITLLLGLTIFPKIFDRLARSSELLFLASLAWVFLISTAVEWFGFSLEIGGFLAGLALANSSENYQIAARIRPLRDFFILVFFVILGSSVVVNDFAGITTPAIVFSLFVLFGNPLIVWILMGLLGYRKRTTFFTGITVAQISEFSLVLAALGLRLGHLSEADVALITLVGIATITVSSYIIMKGDYLYTKLSPYLNWLELPHPRLEEQPKTISKKPIILIGAHRTGQSVLHYLSKKEVRVIDFDPEAIQDLKHRGYDYVFGDAADEEIFEQAKIAEAEVVIATTPGFEDNIALIETIGKVNKSKHKKIKTIVRAKSEEERDALYRAGATYVLWPHFTAGQYLGKAIHKERQLKFLAEWRKKDFELIKKEQALDLDKLQHS
ncbi:MAG: cation:proton antiporter [Anaplasmataceae bacterium]|nr:cation:proton antiporter [Anaplasmataceae bacterium]